MSNRSFQMAIAVADAPSPFFRLRFAPFAASLRTTVSWPLRAASISAVMPPVGWSAFLRCVRSEEHTSELQSQSNLVCRLLLEKKNKVYSSYYTVSLNQH